MFAKFCCSLYCIKQNEKDFLVIYIKEWSTIYFGYNYDKLFLHTQMKHRSSA